MYFKKDKIVFKKFNKKYKNQFLINKSFILLYSKLLKDLKNENKMKKKISDIKNRFKKKVNSENVAKNYQKKN